MAFVTVAELRTTLGIGALYTDAVLQQICDSSNLIIDEYLAKNNAYVDEQQLLSNTVTLYTADINPFVVGQVVTISGCGATFNGSKTITAVDSYSISYVLTGSPADQALHRVSPYGTITGPVHIDYETIAPISEAAMSIAVDIFQSRQAPSGGMTGIDFQPAPYKMGVSLLSRVKGLISPWMSTSGMIG